jgi:hypothetical protein
MNLNNTLYFAIQGTIMISKEMKLSLRHPSLLIRHLNRVLIDGGGNETGKEVMNSDWDNLIILDACRYDFFKSIIAPQLDGSLEKIVSKGSATPEWVKQNFAGQKFHDTVYVSANGWYHRLQDQIDSSLYDAAWLYQDKYRNDMGTVEPELVADMAIQYADQYPNKRLLVHFVQPHKPYLGPTADRNFRHARGINMVQMMSQAKNINDSTLHRAYKETLEKLRPELLRLISNLKGKTVITADHGELLGERYMRMPLKNYGHPHGVYVPELVQVPWFICEVNERRRIVSEIPTNQKAADQDELKEHLQALGYSE